MWKSLSSSEGKGEEARTPGCSWPSIVYPPLTLESPWLKSGQEEGTNDWL